MEEQKDIINEAYLRANSIDAVRGFAYRSGHIRESEELDMARTMIFKLIDYIKKQEISDEEVCDLYDECNKECPLYLFCHPQTESEVKEW